MFSTQLALAALLVGTQGPNLNSDFDWKIKSGEIVIFNTVSTTITSDPPVFTQTFVNGLVDVRDFTIEQGGRLVVVGPNPMVLCASGTVTIDGKLSVDGSDSVGVVTLNTTNLPEVGAAGQGGGGAGGTGSPLTTMSSPAGGNGFGAFGVPDGGGQGGETGWSTTPLTVARRGAGGGGGSFGANQKTLLGGVGLFDQQRIGLDAEPGFDNDQADNGALSGPGAAHGGAVGARPFLDGTARNDFFGTMVVHQPGGRDTAIHGELRQPWAGAGGGAGGDASRVDGTTFPGTFTSFNDEKGAGGGGGAGSVRILALGPIVFGPNGEVTANGGSGGGGENTLFLNRVGGGSGGGSGGHVILETAAHIDLSQVIGEALRARGGQGGAGRVDVGGATIGAGGAIKETQPEQDACPDGYPSSGPNACLGHINGAGGDGGPGIIQLHAPRGLRDIKVALGRTLADLCEPRPLCWEGGCRMVVGIPQPDAAAPVARDAERHLRPASWRLEDLRMGTAP